MNIIGHQIIEGHVCSRCKRTKRADEFSVRRSRPSGRSSWCKACTSAIRKARRQDPALRPRILEKDREHNNSPKTRAWRLARILDGTNAKKSREAYHRRKAHRQPGKIQARARTSTKRRHQKKCNYLVHLLLYFKFLRKEPCKICGKKSTQAAHINYDHPLNIVWLCTRHHRQFDCGIIDLEGNVLCS